MATGIHFYTKDGGGTDRIRFSIRGGDTAVAYFDRVNLGIGTTSPGEELHVHGVMPQVRLTNTWNTHWFTMGTGGGGWSLDTDYGTEPVWVLYDAPNESLFIDSDGTVGFGTTGPSAGLHITREYSDWELRLTDLGTTTNDRSVMLFEDTGGPDWAWGLNTGGDDFFLWYDPGGVSKDILDAWYDTTNGVGWVEIYDNLYVGDYCDFWNVEVFGNLNVHGTKAFRMPHPDNPGLDIVYAALEGPEAGTYVRGTAELENGEAVILLPDHFAIATEAEGVTVQLTPLGNWLQLYVVEKSPTQIVVREVTGKSGQFDYFVQGVRKGYADFQVIQAHQVSPAGMAGREVREPTKGGAPLGTPEPAEPVKQESALYNMIQ